MELYLVLPVEAGTRKQAGDEEIHGRQWRLCGPLDINRKENLKFHCVSYVWGDGTESAGSFFDCKREISDQTRPALAAAIKAAEASYKANVEDILVEAFWIDALCIPQIESAARSKTLASMGFIYSAATSVIIVLNGPVWKVIESVSYKNSAEPLSLDYMVILERDTWVGRVWTYQELVNGRSSLFTTTNLGAEGHFISSEPFFNCISFSLDQWKFLEGKTSADCLDTFPRLNNLEDTLADLQMADYLERSALSVLSNMTYRQFDARYPQNRLLACLGALTKDAAWGPPSTTVPEIGEAFMAICEAKNDYSFIFTVDPRDNAPGLRWRPNLRKLNQRSTTAAHLVPVISWSTWGEGQKAFKDSKGLWLSDMIRLQPCLKLTNDLVKILEEWLYGVEDVKNPKVLRGGFFRQEAVHDTGVAEAILIAIRKMGFTGDAKCHICEDGLFFSQTPLVEFGSVELFAASSIQWAFGSPGIARWKDKGESRYSAGVFVGVKRHSSSASLLLI